jgi:hypothetical protein
MNKERTITPPSQYITFTPTPLPSKLNSQENPGLARTLPSHLENTTRTSEDGKSQEKPEDSSKSTGQNLRRRQIPDISWKM